VQELKMHQLFFPGITGVGDPGNLREA